MADKEVRWGRRRPDTRTEEEKKAAARHQARVERARGRVGVLVEVVDSDE